MARLVKRTLTGPVSFKTEAGEQWVCRCGLSKTQPLCDGSHNLIRGEEAGKLYWYDEAGTRREIPDDFKGIRSF